MHESPGSETPTTWIAPDDGSGGDRLAWWTLGLGLLLLLAGMIRMGQYHGFGPRGTDDQYYFAQARSLLIDGDLDLHRELSTLTPRPENINTSTTRPWDDPTPTGKVPCKYGIGAPLLLLPFLAIGQGLALLFSPLGASTDGYGMFQYLAWSIGNLFHAGLALWLVYRILRSFAAFDRGTALLACWAAFLTGPLVFQTVFDPYMAHVPSTAMVCACAALLYVDRRDSPWRFLMAGLVLGLAMAARQSNLVYGLLFVPRVFAGGRPDFKAVLASGLGVLVGFLPQLLAWKYLYGSFVSYSYQGESLDLWSPHVFENLLGARAGLLIWNPGWALGLLFFPFSKPRSWGLMASILALLWINTAWWCWWWGDTYGGRAYATLFLPVSLGLAVLWKHGQRTWLARSLVLLLLLVALSSSLSRWVFMERTEPAERAAEIWWLLR